MLRNIFNFKNLFTVLFFSAVFTITASYHGSFNKDPEKINPEIYVTFQDIYHSCNVADLSDLSKNCHLVVSVFDRCLSGDLRCPVTDYYKFMNNLGYKLPPLYLE